jgi:hypothetical protein
MEVCGFVDGRRFEVQEVHKMKMCWNWNDGEEVRAARKRGRGDGVRRAECVEVEFQRKLESGEKCECLPPII